MKKSINFKKIIIILSLFFLIGFFSIICLKADETIYDNYIYREIHNVMGTTITVKFHDNGDKDKAKKIMDEIEKTFIKYNILSDNRKSLSRYNEKTLKTNLFKINKNPDKEIEIDKELYDMLIFAEDAKKKTKGYFDYTIGYIIDMWKKAINTGFNYKNNEVPESILPFLQEQINKVKPPSNPIELIEKNSNYFIKIKENVKLDFGAFSKGYVINIVKGFLEKNKYTDYIIDGGSSSISYGTSKEGNGLYKIKLRDPLIPSNPFSDEGVFGYVNSKNNTLTTSGSELQYFKVNGTRYHHIVNPITLSPENYYYSVIILGDDSGKMDAYSTALFSMPLEMAKEFIKENNIEAIFYTTKDDPKTRLELCLNETYFKQTSELAKTNIPKSYKHFIILGLSILLIVSIILIFLILIKQKKIKKSELVMDISLFILLIFISGLGYLNFKFWPKKQKSYAEINYGQEKIACVDFNKNKINIIKKQDSIYPKLKTIENKEYIILLGDFKVNGIKQEVYIEIDFSNKKIRVSKEQSPHNYCSLQGWSDNGAIICLPNKISIVFK